MFPRFLYVFCFFLSVLFLCLHPLSENQFGTQSDEGYYYSYSKTISQNGVGSFHNLIHWYASSEQARKHPNPFRVGYLLLTSTLFKFFGPSYSLLGMVSLISFLIFLGVCFYFARKHFGIDVALMFVLLLSASPLMLGMSRRGLVDSSNNLLWGLAVWLFLDFLDKGSLFKYLLFLMSFFLCLVFKEISIVLLPFFIIFSFWGRHAYGIKISNGQIMGIILWPLLALGCMYGIVLGGWSDLGVLATSLFKTHYQSANPYALYYSSGPWYRYIVDFILLSPVTTLLCIGYVFYLFLNPPANWKKTYFLCYFIIVYSLLSSFQHSKVVRFAINLDMVMCLFSVFMVFELFRRLESQQREKWLLFALVIIFAVNFKSFLNIFYFPSLLDPISANLLSLQWFIPMSRF